MAAKKKTEKAADLKMADFRSPEQKAVHESMMEGVKDLRYNPTTRRIEQTGEKARVSTNTVQPPATPEVEFSKAVPGPRTDGMGGVSSGMSDAEYLSKMAPGELKSLREKVERKKGPVEGAKWIDLPGGTRIPGDNILAGCEACGKWLWVRAKEGAIGEGSLCAKCQRRGTLRPATDAERASWFEREEKKEAAWKAGAEKRRAEVIDFNRRHAQDRKDTKSDLAFAGHR